MALPRLTARVLARAERGGKAQGWYELCRQGYLPGEIAAIADKYPPDVRTTVQNYAERNNLPMPATCAPKRTRSIRLTAPTDPREAFRDAVMQTNLCLTLSRAMLEMLCAIADDVHWDRRYGGGDRRVRPDNYYVTVHSLIRRGLVVHHESRNYALSRVGQRLIDLLKEAGIFARADIGHEHAKEYRALRREIRQHMRQGGPR